MSNNNQELRIDVLAKGYTSTVYKLTDIGKVLKVLDRGNARAHFEVERRAYERMSQYDSRPDSILKYYGVNEEPPAGLVLELAEKGSLYSYLRRFFPSDPGVSLEIKRSWARHAAEALAFVHKCGIIHCDVHAANFFLDENGKLKLGDFGAASIDGERPLLLYRTSHQLWMKDDGMKDDGGKWHREISVASEIFALGCVLYNIEMSNGLFAELERKHDDEEIRRRLKEREMPDTGNLSALGSVIQKCWTLKYQSMEEILEDLPPSDGSATSGHAAASYSLPVS